MIFRFVDIGGIVQL